MTSAGRLADPTGLPFDAAHLAEYNALTTALDDLLALKPCLAPRCRRRRARCYPGKTHPSTSLDSSGAMESRR
ncbi:hypothetical protein NOCA2150118 [metagenome]|uniref:Uncharacterized protein n=1 Tax=metagenome TaxID=256318 RepID=A0A2P2BXA5_9ZZZZ